MKLLLSGHENNWHIENGIVFNFLTYKYRTQRQLVSRMRSSSLCSMLRYCSVKEQI